MDVNYGLEGVVFDIQRFSLHDGPGIRTIVFLKGCPLSCKWCSNPESQSLKPTLMYQADQCIHCGICIEVCPQGALSPGNPGFVDRQKCIACGECEANCPAWALTIKGKSMSVQDVVRELKKDVSYYRHSGGGITISGGEPLVQAAFAAELLKACKIQGWHTAMETTGYTADERAIEDVFPFLDLVLLDVKSCDSAIHQKFTGVTTDIIRRNSVRITELAKTVIRVPTIPGVNASVRDFKKVCEFAKTLRGVETIHILPYHAYGENKYELMGEDYPMQGTRSLTPEEIDSYKRTVENNGFRCIVGG